MKLILYYLSLLVFIAVLCGFLLSEYNTMDNMSMNKMLGVSLALVVYVVAMSLVGEGPEEDEREHHHRQLANRVALIVGTAILSLAVLYQMFTSYHIDYWLLGALVGINLTKIVSLIYLNYRR
ncbi:MAG: hypothetical protein R3B41_00915 [Candidatus Doudnabacteria bacterium]